MPCEWTADKGPPAKLYQKTAAIAVFLKILIQKKCYCSFVLIMFVLNNAVNLYIVLWLLIAYYRCILHKMSGIYFKIGMQLSLSSVHFLIMGVAFSVCIKHC